MQHHTLEYPNCLQVAPAELEDHLNSHDSVLDAAVVPFINGNLEELPRAYGGCMILTASSLH